jgi:methionine synthase II (cobalamin-independent)
MGAERNTHPIVHFVGSIPLPDTESVFRTLSAAAGPHLTRLPDGETGIRKSWIRFLQDVLAEHPAIERADVPPFRFVQWDGKVVREIPRLRIKPGAKVDAGGFKTGYADMAIDSWAVFERMQKAGTIPADVRFQVCLPTPIAPVYNNIVPEDRQAVLAPLTEHFAGEVAKIAAVVPNNKLAIQWDVCQEVLAWEGYYDKGPVDFRTETLDVLAKVGDAVPAAVELGYHLCYGSPADEHLVQPKDTALMVEMVNAIAARVARPIEFFHLPVPKGRTDDAYYAPLAGLKLRPGTELYLGLVHHNDTAGNSARLVAARRHARVDGVATECGMARGDPARLPELLAAHVKAAELAA